MKVPKFAILLTFSVLVFGIFSAASALTQPTEPVLAPDYFEDGTATHSVNIYYVGNSSIDEYGALEKAGTVGGVDVYDRPTTSDLTPVIIKANISGTLSATYAFNGSDVDATVTGSVFLLANGVLTYVSSGSALEASGMVAYVSPGLNTISVIYMNMDDTGAIKWASDTVLVRAGSNLGSLTDDSYAANVSITVNDDFSEGSTVGYNDTGVTTDFGVTYNPDLSVKDDSGNIGDNANISLTVDTDTTGSAKMIDDILDNGTVVDYSEQDFFYDGAFAYVYFNVLAGDDAVAGKVLFFDSVGVYEADVSSATLIPDTAYGVITFNPMGLTAAGWGTGQHIDVGSGDYSANFGANIYSNAVSQLPTIVVNTSETTVTSTEESTPISTVAVFFGLLALVPVVRKFRK